MRISAPGDCNHALRQLSGALAVQKIAVVAYSMQQAAKGGSHVKTLAYKRFGSKADILRRESHVRFTPESGHVRCNYRCPLWARSGHVMRRLWLRC
jgi:hypothetical protein